MSAHPLRVHDYLAHMLDAVSQIQHYMAGKTAEDFQSDRLLQDGVVRNFEILDEGSKKILDADPGAAVKNPGIPFAAIYGMRNQLSHAYFVIDFEVAWKVIERDLPALRSELEAVLATMRNPTSG